MEETTQQMLVPSAKWTAKQKPRSKRFVPAPTSDDYSQWTVDQLKLECTQRRLEVAKTTNKEGRVRVLNMFDQNTTAMKDIIDGQRQVNRRKQDKPDDDRRKPGSMIRLVNVLFSDKFLEEFLRTGDSLTRAQLEAGGHIFWDNVACEFNADKSEYDVFIKTDERFRHVDPSDGGVMSGVKLALLWRELSGLFSKAVAHSKQSGEHSNSFWDYCNKRIDVYYLHLATEARNAGREFCSSNFYSDDELDSTVNFNEEQQVDDNTSSKRKRTSLSGAKSDDAMASIAKSVSIMVDTDRAMVQMAKRESTIAVVTRLEASIERVLKRIKAVDTAIDGIQSNGNDADHLENDRARLYNHLRNLEQKLENAELVLFE